MPQMHFPVGIIVEKRKSTNPWIDHTWSLVAALPGLPEAAPMTLIERQEGAERYYLGAANVLFSSSETAHYRDNLATGAPRLWVICRREPIDDSLILHQVTADPSEGEAGTEAGGDFVESVAMAPEIAAALATFVAEHHVERIFFKRKRDAAPGSTRKGGGLDQGGEEEPA